MHCESAYLWSAQLRGWISGCKEQAFCNRFTSLSRSTDNRGGSSAGMWASGADRGPVKHSICAPSQRISWAPQPGERFLAACLNTARSTLAEQEAEFKQAVSSVIETRQEGWQVGGFLCVPNSCISFKQVITFSQMAREVRLSKVSTLRSLKWQSVRYGHD